MWSVSDSAWAIKYNNWGGRPWIHNCTIRRTRNEAINAIRQETYSDMPWPKLKKFLDLSVVKVRVLEKKGGM